MLKVNTNYLQQKEGSFKYDSTNTRSAIILHPVYLIFDIAALSVCEKRTCVCVCVCVSE